MRDLPAPAPDDPRALDLHIATCSLYVGLVLRAPHTSREEEVPPSRAPPPRSPDVPQMHGASRTRLQAAGTPEPLAVGGARGGDPCPAGPAPHVTALIIALRFQLCLNNSPSPAGAPVICRCRSSSLA